MVTVPAESYGSGHTVCCAAQGVLLSVPHSAASLSADRQPRPELAAPLLSISYRLGNGER